MDEFLKTNDKMLKRHRRSVFLDNKINLSFTSSKNPSDAMQGGKVDKTVLSQDVVYKSMRPVYLFLRIMGVFPYTRPKPGNASFAIISPAMGYSIFIFIMLATYVIFIAISRIKVVQSLEGRFEESVIAYLFLVNILPILIIPMIWTETGIFSKVLNSWTDFEVVYYKVSGRILPLKMKSKGLWVAICLPILSSISVVVTHVTMVDFKVSQVVPYCILDNLTYMMGGYWYLACQTIRASASILANDFQKLLTTMVTYLVVLLQFQISIPDDTSSFNNMFNTTQAPNTTES